MIYFSIFAIVLYTLTKSVGYIWSGVFAVKKSKQIGVSHILLSKGWIALYREIIPIEDDLDYVRIRKLSLESSNYEETLPIWTEYHRMLELLTKLEIMQNEFHQDGYKNVDIVTMVGDTITTMNFDDYVNAASDERDVLYDQAIYLEEEFKQEESFYEN